MRQAALLPWLVLFVLSGCATAGRPRRARAPVPEKAKAVVRTARSYLPEEDKGRKTPRDCSDFVSKVFAENGIALPRTSAAMSRLGDPIASSRDLRMGDLLFFSGEKVSRSVGHVAVYVGNGIFIHLSKPDAGVTMDSLYSDYYRKRYLSARRLIL